MCSEQGGRLGGLEHGSRWSRAPCSTGIAPPPPAGKPQGQVCLESPEFWAQIVGETLPGQEVLVKSGLGHPGYLLYTRSADSHYIV